MWNMLERRVKRSGRIDEALGMLLRAQRARGDLDLIVLATTDGLLVAYDGGRDECEELAAYAPFLAEGHTLAIDPRRIRGVTAHAFIAGRQQLVLLMRGGGNETLVTALASASVQGAARILQG